MSNLIYAHVHILTEVCILTLLDAYFSSLTPRFAISCSVENVYDSHVFLF